MVKGWRKNLSLVLYLGFLFSSSSAYASSSSVPPWVSDLPIPKNEPLYLVVKGTFASRSEAENLKKFIQQLMVKYPGDGLDPTDNYEGLPPGKFVVGTLFDSQDRALWWINFSYRNRKIGRGQVQMVKLKGESHLPYMPSAFRGGKKQLLSEQEALSRVKALPDVQSLSASKKLQFKITDYPKNGDLRYEIEILEDKGKLDPMMVDFLMVSALDGQITERYSQALGKKNFLSDKP